MKLGAKDLPRSYWRRKAIEEKGMCPRLFRDRAYRWGDPKRACEQPVRQVRRDYTQPESTAEKLRQAGLHQTSVHHWRKRHPDSDLADDQVIERIQANKARFRAQQAFKAECRRRGLNPNTVREWQKKYGLTEEQALERHPVSAHESGLRGKRSRSRAIQQENNDGR